MAKGKESDNKESEKTPAADDTADDKKTDKKPDPPAADDGAAATPPGKKERTYSKAEQDAAVAKAVAEAKKKFEDEKDLSELERLQKENDDLRSANRLRDAKDAVITALSKAGAKAPELLFRSIAGELEFDDKGGLKNVDALVTGLKTDYADQFGTSKPTDGVDAGKGQDTSGTKLTQKALAAMTPEGINKLDWEEVSKVLADPNG